MSGTVGDARKRLQDQVSTVSPREHFAVVVAALLAGRIDGQQAVASATATHERILAALHDALIAEAKVAGAAEVVARVEALASSWSVAAGKPGESNVHNARRAVYLRCRDELRAALCSLGVDHDE